jgi:hemolysin III
MSDSIPSVASRGTLPLHRHQSRGEEIANSISHGMALLAALVGAQVLITHAARHQAAINIVGASIFSASMILMYLASMLYHAVPHHKGKHIFRVFDHVAIYVLIAGTYTPFALGVLRGAWGWTILGLVWSLAFIGIASKVFGGIRHPRVSMALYLGMGWLVLVVMRPLYLHMPHAGVLWLLAGGVAYTAGTPFFAVDGRMRYGHFIWHLFVITGTCCHYVAVLGYAV